MIFLFTPLLYPKTNEYYVYNMKKILIPFHFTIKNEQYNENIILILF